MVISDDKPKFDIGALPRPSKTWATILYAIQGDTKEDDWEAYRTVNILPGPGIVISFLDTSAGFDTVPHSYLPRK